MDDEDFTVWKRVSVAAIAAVIIVGVLSIAYFWYEARFLTVIVPTDAVSSERYIDSVQKQQNLLKSFTAPAGAATSSVVMQTPASFDALPQSAKAAARQQPSQAELNSFTAPTQ